MNKKDYPQCRHCSSRLRPGVNTTICKNCKMSGHKEFSECNKCPK